MDISNTGKPNTWFRGITAKILPDGELATVYPFHVCTEGQEDRIIFRDDEDLETAFNFIAICAFRANVIIVNCIVLHTHIHAVVLAKCKGDSDDFIKRYKMSVSSFCSRKYKSIDISKSFKNINAGSILLDSNQYLRNAICYVSRNSLDMGIRVEDYRWSGHRALFRKDKYAEKTKDVDSMSYREKRKMFHSDSLPAKTGWKVAEDGTIDPRSFCDWEYAENAFHHDLSFYMRVLGFCDDNMMEHKLVISPYQGMSSKDLVNTIEYLCKEKYGICLAGTTTVQKIPMIRTIYRTIRTTPAQLARYFGVEKTLVENILKR